MKYKYYANFYFKWKGREDRAVEHPALTSIKNVDIDIPEEQNFLKGSSYMKNPKIVDNGHLWDNLKYFFEECIRGSYFTIITNDENIVDGEKYKKICDMYMKISGKTEIALLKFDINVKRNVLKEKEERLNYLRRFL